MNALQKLNEELGINVVSSIDKFTSDELRYVVVLYGIKYIEFVNITDFCNIVKEIRSGNTVFTNKKLIKPLAMNDSYIVYDNATKSLLISMSTFKSQKEQNIFVNQAMRKFNSALLGVNLEEF